MAKLFVESKFVDTIVGETSFLHLYLVYEDDIGDEFVIRGGPTGGFLVK